MCECRAGVRVRIRIEIYIRFQLRFVARDGKLGRRGWELRFGSVSVCVRVSVWQPVCNCERHLCRPCSPVCRPSRLVPFWFRLTYKRPQTEHPPTCNRARSSGAGQYTFGVYADNDDHGNPAAIWRCTMRHRLPAHTRRRLPGRWWFNNIMRIIAVWRKH